MAATKEQVQELSYSVYEMRQRDEVQPMTLDMRSSLLRKGNKFYYANGVWSPAPYPGVSVVSMMDYDGENTSSHADLCDIQNRLGKMADLPSALYLLPPDSFHQTLANTFSADRYDKHVVQSGLEETYPELLHRAFDDIHVTPCEEPIVMQLIGLSLFHTAIGLLGVFPEQRDFERVLAFRDGFYGHPDLQDKGLVRTRPFIGHVTLAYIEASLDVEACRHLVGVLRTLNAEIKKMDLKFVIRETEPRCYDHLAAFEPRPEFPRFSFV